MSIDIAAENARTDGRGTGTEVSLAAQQMTVNLLRDLGAEPETLMGGIEPAPRNPLGIYGAVPGSTGSAPVRRWDGTSYVDQDVYIWDGTQYLRVDPTLG